MPDSHSKNFIQEVLHKLILTVSLICSLCKRRSTNVSG